MKIQVSSLKSQVSSLKSQVSRLVLCLVVSFPLFFVSCHKDILLEMPITTSKSKDLTPTITVEEVRDWYEKTLAEQKGTSSLREDSILLIDVGPRWAESLNGFSLTTDEFLMTPLTLSASQQHSQFKLLTTRQTNGSLTGKLVIYTPTPAYHIAKNGKYSVSDFTGTVLYTDLSGKFEYGLYIENGLYKGQAIAKSRDRPNTNTLGVRGCTTTSYSICIDFDYDPGQVLRLGCMYTVDISMTNCTSGSTGGSGNGSGGMGSGGGGGAWNSSQPTNLFSTSEIEALRTKFRNANLDDIFYTLELQQGLLKAANLFLDTRGWDNLNKPALENLVNTTGEYQALAEYLTALSVYTDFYNANVNTNTLVSTFVAFAKYNKAGFTAEKFVKLYSNAPLFTQLNAYLARNSNNIDAWENVKEIESEYERENNPLDVTFAQDAELHLKLLEQSSEFVELSNSLNTLGGIGSGNSPMKNVLLDLLLEGAQEWAENFLGIPDLQELRGLLEQGVESTGKKVAFKATRIIARFIAKKNPLFNALSSMWKAKQIYSKISRVYKRLNGLWQNRYFVGIEQKLEKVYESLKRNKLLDEMQK